MKSFNHRLYFLVVVAVLALIATFAKAKPVDAPSGSYNKVAAAEKFAYGMYAIRQSMTIRLAFQNSTGGHVHVRIKDAQGTVIHRETLRNVSEMKRNYDLSAFGKGIYTVGYLCRRFSGEQ